MLPGGGLEDNESEEENNEEVLDLMLKYNFITVESTDKLIEQNKLQINNIESVLEKYRGINTKTVIGDEEYVESSE